MLSTRGAPGPPGRGGAGVVTSTRSRARGPGSATSARSGHAPSSRGPDTSRAAHSLGPVRTPSFRTFAPPASPPPSQPLRPRHVFASRGEARDQSRTPARRESWWNANRAETPAFWRRQRRKREGRRGVGGRAQPAQTHRVHLRCHRPGRQGLPAGGRPGGSPEAPRLHGQVPVPQNPAHPAASQVTARTQRPPLRAWLPTFGISRATRSAFPSQHLSSGKPKAKQLPLPLPYVSESKLEIDPKPCSQGVLIGEGPCALSKVKLLRV